MFAFLGHCSVTESSNTQLRDIVPDYDNTAGTVPRVYAHTAACALRGRGGGAKDGLIVLGSVQHQTLAKTDSEWKLLRSHSEYIPSWVPD